MAMAWLWHGYGMAMAWLWHGYGMAHDYVNYNLKNISV